MRGMAGTDRAGGDEDDARAEADFSPWRRVARAGDAHKHELFDRAAPVFARHGYRGATMKALAHACGVKPATLYHYFRSKREMATFPLTGPRLNWESTFVDPDVDPLVQLRMLIDLAKTRLPAYLLAIRLADEIGDPRGSRQRGAAFRQGEAVFGRLIGAAAPGMDQAEALDLARHLLSLLVGANLIDLDAAPEATARDRMIGALRARLVPRHVGELAFDTAMRDDRTNR